MKLILSVLLSFVILNALSIPLAIAQIINQETFKTHLRWNVNVPRDQINIVKNDLQVRLETVNLELFEKMSAELSNSRTNDQYLEQVTFNKDNFPARPAAIIVKLKDSSVELFNFYRDADKKFILDFWINPDLMAEKKPSFNKPLPLPSEEIKPKKVALPIKTKVLENLNQKVVAKADVEVKKEDIEVAPTNPDLRDFRYGASFMWDYQPMIPQLEKDINLSSKIPDSLYPIKDRELLDDPKEAHMQLSINFYKEGRWGLMNKSMSLYEKKYGRDANYVLNEFMKANSLLKENITKTNRSITQSSMVLLANIKDLSPDYDLKSAILRYLIQYHVDMKDHVKTLELAKQLFVEARSQFDQTYVIQSALTILHSLAQLKQVDKIEELMKDKKLAAIMPPQMSLAYATFALLSKGETKEIIKRYRTVEKALAKPVHPAILYNVAESLFRESDYEGAIVVYDEFLSTYSYLLQAPFARLRIALSYELLDRPARENLVLYKNAIDRSTDGAARYEAKLRYVGMKLVRKLNISAEDKELEVFLEQSPDESKAFNQNLKKLLWLVRLRLFIATKEYEKALTYLTALPMDSLKPAERRVFEADGAEIVFGMIHESYLKEDYAKAVKIWEVYRDKYETKVARNLYMNFVVCDAYIKLGLFKSYDRALASFKEVEKEERRTYPIWVERVKKTNLSEMIEELNVIRLLADEKWQEASDKLATYPVSLRDSINYPYYQGIVNFHLKNYQDASSEFEKVLIKQNPGNQLTPRQTAELLMGYVESLYQMKDQERFKTVVKALNEDIGKSKSAPILNISERINYLLIEAYAGEGSPEWKEIENMTKAFREKFQKSPYSSRIGYLYGLSLIKNSKVSEGKEILSVLTTDKDVPLHIKEMCKSELATLELVEKKL